MSKLTETATHITGIIGKLPRLLSNPSDPEIGDMYYNTTRNAILRWTGNNWLGVALTTTSTSSSTSTSTSTTTTA